MLQCLADAGEPLAFVWDTFVSCPRSPGALPWVRKVFGGDFRRRNRRKGASARWSVELAGALEQHHPHRRGDAAGDVHPAHARDIGPHFSPESLERTRQRSVVLAGDPVPQSVEVPSTAQEAGLGVLEPQAAPEVRSLDRVPAPAGTRSAHLAWSIS